MDAQHVLLHLSLIKGIGPAVIEQIIAGISIERWPHLYDFTEFDWHHIAGVSPKAACKIVTDLSDRSMLEKELELIEKHNVSWITILDSHYPALLKHIHLPPPVLYWQGSLFFDDRKKIAIVGSRKANMYGQRVIESLVPPLIAHNFEIVSGGALGADSMAHRATVESGGITKVILGSGLLYPYPYANKQLFARIKENNGAVMSIFPMQTEPNPGLFPARNRVIAGLSDGCIVVQAAAQSGARITAQLALEQGRTVFAVPGLIDDELSAGCHALLREGATLVRDSNDILQEFGIETEPDNAVQQQRSITDLVTDTPEQNVVIKACIQPCSIDELAARTQLSLAELQTLLFNLQLDGRVLQDFTGMWKTNGRVS